MGSTGTISANVDNGVKRIANIYIRRAGLTPSEVIRSLWNHIAQTGDIPEYARPHEGVRDESDAMRRLLSVRRSIPAGTPLDVMDAAGMREELMCRDA